MKTFRSIVAVFAFAAIFAVSAFAQAAASPKIGIVNTGAFDTKEGINKYVNAMNTLETQMKPELTVLQTMGNRLQALKTELEGLQNQLNDPKLPPAVDKNKLQTTAQTKYEEYQKIGLEFEYKQKDYKASLERKEATVMSPVRQDIGNALQEFAKKNGYMMILDASKLDQNGLLLAFDAKFDVTKEFITFFNTRPATTAAAVK
ncbi:MAG: OmpH family outer membrane protein [Acidobacteriota bacterium]|jgi:Skp family chaperone for outer membrane proteins|nr:OmpH family outer membrane protein [Acidobacteriota bacterium]